MYLILRKYKAEFKSIEKVFEVLMKHLNVNSIELPYYSEGLLKRIYNILFVLKFRNELIHISGHDHYILWFPFRKAILTIHDIEALKRKSGWKRWIFKKLWFDIPIRNSKEITTISEFTKNELLTIKNYRTPIRVIHNPISINVEYQPRASWSDKIQILHIGTKSNKNLVRLLEALEEIECHLTIVGKLEKVHLDKLKMSDLEYTNRINVSEEELIQLYKKSDLLAFVSTYEGFGLPIIEAQSIGRVVLTSSLSSMPEVAGKGAYFVNPYSVDEIRKGILWLKDNPKKRQNLIKAGIENIDRFKPTVIAKQYEELYQKHR